MGKLKRILFEARSGDHARIAPEQKCDGHGARRFLDVTGELLPSKL